MTSWQLHINRPAEWLNLNQRLHWGEKSRRTHQWRQATRLYARAAKLPRGLERVCIEAFLHFPDRRRRDAGNWSPTVKACVDGLVDYGLIPDDSDANLIGPDLRTGEPHRVGQVVLTIEELL